MLSQIIKIAEIIYKYITAMYLLHGWEKAYITARGEKYWMINVNIMMT